jgi:hypothetical protein
MHLTLFAQKVWWHWVVPLVAVFVMLLAIGGALALVVLAVTEAKPLYLLFAVGVAALGTICGESRDGPPRKIGSSASDDMEADA